MPPPSCRTKVLGWSIQRTTTFGECVTEPVARAVLVTSPPGAGKSRLRHEFMRRLHSQGTVADGDGNDRPVQMWIGRGAQ